MGQAGFRKPWAEQRDGAPAFRSRTSPMSRNTPRLCFIGFGEAGQAFASGLRGAGVTTMSAWDILFADPAGRPGGAGAPVAGGGAGGGRGVAGGGTGGGGGAGRVGGGRHQGPRLRLRGGPRRVEPGGGA